jgi:hypothetical protein
MPAPLRMTSVGRRRLWAQRVESGRRRSQCRRTLFPENTNFTPCAAITHQDFLRSTRVCPSPSLLLAVDPRVTDVTAIKIGHVDHLDRPRRERITPRTRMAHRARIRRNIALVAGWAAHGPARKASAAVILSGYRQPWYSNRGGVLTPPTATRCYRDPDHHRSEVGLKQASCRESG